MNTVPAPTASPLLSVARKQFHADLLQTILTVDAAGIPSNAAYGITVSRLFAQGIYAQITTQAATISSDPYPNSDRKFQNMTHEFLSRTFPYLAHIRPGVWDIRATGQSNSDYTIEPDIIIAREPEDDAAINAVDMLVDETVAVRSTLRKTFSSRAILHASISSKWTLRSDRAQNARSEALNLIRNRKGRLPHIVVVTGEPLPSRIASLALGTGDIDCVYHFALNELIQTVNASTYDDSKELLEVMVEGKRLKDIADLPLDLAV